jgi:hypothetical protein
MMNSQTRKISLDKIRGGRVRIKQDFQHKTGTLVVMRIVSVTLIREKYNYDVTKVSEMKNMRIAMRRKKTMMMNKNSIKIKKKRKVSNQRSCLTIN